MAAEREYLSRNPWITFTYRATQDRLWVLLGEAFSKCQHMAGTPLQPGLADKLSGIYLIKGAVATTAIEGNTLTEAEVAEILDEGKRLPPSQQYLEQEVRNIIAALENIDASARRGRTFRVTPEWIKEQNRQTLEGIEGEDHVAPGRYTERQLVVGNYRAAPPEDVEYLVDRLCDWLNEWLRPLSDPATPDDQRFFHSFFAATLGHLYLAWIHPFGDGNGRTARLLECAILAHSAVVPWVSSNLLSDHYNRTRSHYYARLSAASREGDVDGFVRYSAQGFVDLLREQIREVRQMQRRVAWINAVHERLGDEPAGPTHSRRLELTLALPEGKATPRRALRRLTIELAEMYAGKSDKTVTRDVGRLVQLDLIRTVHGGYAPNIEMMDAFRPIAPQWAQE